MTEHPADEGLPQHAVCAAAFAGRLIVQNKGENEDFFPAFVGLVSARDKHLAAECLLALEEAIAPRSNADNRA